MAYDNRKRMIQLDPETRYQLQRLKRKMELPSYDKVIDKLISEYLKDNRIVIEFHPIIDFPESGKGDSICH